jgi:hypothetical protein
LGVTGIVFALLIALILVLYSAERRVRRLWLMLLVRVRWFPQGAFLLACMTDDADWNGFLADELAPQIGDSAVIVDLHSGDASRFERSLAREFVAGLDDTRSVVVFMPYLEYRVVEFGPALDLPDEQDMPNGPRAMALARTAAALMELVEQGRERMRMYI